MKAEFNVHVKDESKWKYVCFVTQVFEHTTCMYKQVQGIVARVIGLNICCVCNGSRHLKRYLYEVMCKLVFVSMYVQCYQTMQGNGPYWSIFC
jgi:hypothetical protein